MIGVIAAALLGAAAHASMPATGLGGPYDTNVKLMTGSDESEDSPAELEAIAARLRAAWPR